MRLFQRLFDLPRALGLVCILLAGQAIPVSAQGILSLIEFTNTWRYEQSGRDLGTAWRLNDYNDSAWPEGPGLLGAETDPLPYPVPINTPLDLSAPDASMQTVTYYFRAQFDFPTNAVGPDAVLIVTNVLDDGCVIFLNGMEAGRLRVPRNQTYLSLATGGPPTEGALELLNLSTASLRGGENVLAVEVHQASVGSSDIVWGARLLAFVPEALVITNQPQNQTNFIGGTASFSAGVAGSPARYQWQKGGVNILGATSNTLVLANLTAAGAGDYQLIASNTLGSITSRVATLTVLPDLFGPTLVAAIVRASSLSISNIIEVLFSERLDRADATNLVNYLLTRRGTTDPVTITNALNNGPAVRLDVGGSNWVLGADYVLTVNHVRDRFGNVIAPDSQIQVSWPQSLEVISTTHSWRFHTAALFEPDIFDQSWVTPDYIGSVWWSSGTGPFCAGPVLQAGCFGPCTTAIGFQPEPSLFRTSFVWPGEFITNATLELAHVIDDGAVFFLNGQEILRRNLPASPALLTATTRTTNSVTTLTCATNLVAVSNLMVGSNWLAVAVFQQRFLEESDAVFALQIRATTTRQWELGPNAPPTLEIARMTDERVAVSWTGAGYSLESATNVSSPLSYPWGPWTEVTNMTNPYFDVVTDPQRFYRLRK